MQYLKFLAIATAISVAVLTSALAQDSSTGSTLSSSDDPAVVAPATDNTPQTAENQQREKKRERIRKHSTRRSHKRSRAGVHSGN